MLIVCGVDSDDGNNCTMATIAHGDDEPLDETGMMQLGGIALRLLSSGWIAVVVILVLVATRGSPGLLTTAPPSLPLGR